MIVQYNYIDRNRQEFGDFECDLEDFRAFLRSRLTTNIEAMVVKFEDGRIYIWQRSMVNIKREGYHKGWALAQGATVSSDSKDTANEISSDTGDSTGV